VLATSPASTRATALSETTFCSFTAFMGLQRYGSNM